MICGVCKGVGNTTPEQVTALACEMIKIASDMGEPGDPFAGWESIDLIKTERGHLHNQWRACWAPLTPRSENEKQGVDRVLAILKAKLSDGGGIVGPSDVQRAHNDFAVAQARRLYRFRTCLLAGSREDPDRTRRDAPHRRSTGDDRTGGDGCCIGGFASRSRAAACCNGNP
nr:hypothetical protein [uncultured Rhizobium sp.]